MTQLQKMPVFFLRVALGWLFFWSGITKVLDPAWSAAGYLQGAKNLAGFYHWLAAPTILPFINFLNEWGLTLLGLSLILGLFVRLGAIMGSILMLLYYLPILQFPYPDPHSFLVDQHIIYIAALFVLASVRAGRAWGLEPWCSRLPVCLKFPKLRAWLG